MRTPTALRAQLSAIYLLVANLIGIGMGSTMIAIVSDTFLDERRLGLAMAIVAVISGVAASAMFYFCRCLDRRRRAAVLL